MARKIRQKLPVILFGMLATVSCCGLIYGRTSASVTNHFETGIVDIRLAEYQIKDGKEEAWEDNRLILPGDEISKIPRIYNDGADCYVRAKITVRLAEGMGEEALSGIEFVGMDDRWFKADDGFYYDTEILAHGEDVDLFRVVRISENLPQTGSEGKLFHIDIDVDAVQSKNFVPEFAASVPWGDVEILACGKEGAYDIRTFKRSDTKSFSVVYLEEVNQLITNCNDFFANIPCLMPGDCFSDSLELKNDGNHDRRLYFRSEKTDDSDLPDKIALKITTEIGGKEKVFYDGTLSAGALAGDVILGVVPGNMSGIFKFEIQVPAELNNVYSISNSAVRWIFSTEPIPERTEPKTGVRSHIGFYLYLLILSITAIGYIRVRSWRREHGEEEENDG